MPYHLATPACTPALYAKTFGQAMEMLITATRFRQALILFRRSNIAVTISNIPLSSNITANFPFFALTR
jgi:hypothetical protein